MLLIDSHVHVGQYFDRYFSPQQISSLMKTVGVDYYAVSSTTMCEENYPKVLDELQELIRLDGDKVLPVMWITPEGLKGNIAWFLESDIKWRCVKIHPYLHSESWVADSDNCKEVVDIARELKIPLLIHTGDEPCCQAKKYEYLILKNPDVVFILAHGRPINDAICLAQKYSNAYIDSAFMPISDMQQIISLGLSHKLLWGTDMCIPAHFYPNVNMREYYNWNLTELGKICSAAEYELITYRNASKIFNINQSL